MLMWKLSTVVYIILGATSIIFLMSLLAQKFRRCKGPTLDAIERDADVYTAIVELRALADSDRAFLMRFHNGEEFTPSDDIWKLTCTHEVVRPGVTYEASKTHGIVFSKMARLVAPLLTGAANSTGVEFVRDCGDCPFKDSCKRKGRFMILVDVESLPMSYDRNLLEEQNVKTAFYCGLTKGGGVFGIIGIHYAVKVPPEDYPQIVERFCKSSGVIQHLICKSN